MFWKIKFVSLLVLITVSLIDCSHSFQARKKAIGKFGPISGYLINRFLDLGDIAKVSVSENGLGAKIYVSTIGIGAHRSYGSGLCLSSNFTLTPLEKSGDITYLFTLWDVFPCDFRKDLQSFKYEVLGFRSYLLSNYFRIGASASLGIGLRVEVNPAELVDFLFGFIGVDFMQDDIFEYREVYFENFKSLRTALINKDIIETERILKELSPDKEIFRVTLRDILFEESYIKQRFFPAIEAFLKNTKEPTLFLHTAMNKNDKEAFNIFVKYLTTDYGSHRDATTCDQTVIAGATLGNKEMLESIIKFCNYRDSPSLVSKEVIVWAKNPEIIKFLKEKAGNSDRIKNLYHDSIYSSLMKLLSIRSNFSDTGPYQENHLIDSDAFFEGNYSKALDFYLSHGINPNEKTRDGSISPFEYAALRLKGKDLDLIKVMVKYGGDPSLNSQNRLPIFREVNDPIIKEYLKTIVNNRK